MNLNTDGNFLSRKALGQAIKKQRKRLAEKEFAKKQFPYGFTQQDLCDCLNRMFDAEINVKKLSRVEAGHQEPSFSLIVQIAFVLGGPHWRSTLCKIVEDSLPGDIETSELTAFADYWDYRAFFDAIDRAADRHARAERLGGQITQAAAELQDMLHEMNALIVEGHTFETQGERTAHNLEVTSQIIKRTANEAATPAPTQGAVAIDEPQGKEHEHEQD